MRGNLRPVERQYLMHGKPSHRRFIEHYLRSSYSYPKMSQVALAESILHNVKKLEERGVIDPSSKLGFRDMTYEDLKIRATAINAIRNLESQMLGPMESLCSLCFTRVGHVAWNFEFSLSRFPGA